MDISAFSAQGNTLRIYDSLESSMVSNHRLPCADIYLVRPFIIEDTTRMSKVIHTFLKTQNGNFS
ncbi:unnamed protein product [Hymenolepis diminuta]|uniref:Uncharacterized protein n=1 Tax=Hymenolepis diminuta TaxID=6216 RepID=A0A564YIU3_HYMDI|nr:unnamed protein product [Hymenolepis diminuta]